MAYTKPERLTLSEALKDFGWFSIVFAVTVSGPSVLSLLQSVFVDHRLVDALQWIVDGYHRLVAVIGAIFEPIVLPFVEWINRLLDVELHLQEYWKALFVLEMVFVVGVARTAWRNGQRLVTLAYGLTCGMGALIGAVASGLVEADGAWGAQGLIAMLPITSLALAVAVSSMFLRAVNGDNAASQDLLAFGMATASLVTVSLFLLLLWPQIAGGLRALGVVLLLILLLICWAILFVARQLAGTVSRCILFGTLAFVLAAAGYFVPQIGTGAGILATGVMILALGVTFLSWGMADAWEIEDMDRSVRVMTMYYGYAGEWRYESTSAAIDLFPMIGQEKVALAFSRLGLTLLGGFATAGAILAADASLRLLAQR